MPFNVCYFAGYHLLTGTIIYEMGLVCMLCKFQFRCISVFTGLNYRV